MAVFHFRGHGLAAVALMAALTLSQDASADPLAFEARVGGEASWLLQDERGTFHVAVSERPRVRLVVASPAGNAGCALWLGAPHAPTLLGRPEAVGPEAVQVTLGFDQGTCVTSAILGSLRVVREFDEKRRLPPTAFSALGRLEPGAPLAQRLRAWLAPRWLLDRGGRRASRRLEGLDGVSWYEVTLDADRGSFALSAAFTDDPAGEVLTVPAATVRLTYRSSWQPPTPVPADELFAEGALARLKALPADQGGLMAGLRFLASRESFLAGSWRYLTYFGRDTLISLRLLAPVITPAAMEAGLAAVARRLSPEGEVAHEEALGCQAALERLGAWLEGGALGPPPADLASPWYDRKMVDDDFLVLPLLRDYHAAGGRELFSSGHAASAPLLRNVDRVLALAARRRLLSLPEGQKVGDWRDSEKGLGYGRYPFSVNAAHVPAALEAFAALAAAGVLEQREASRLGLVSLLRALSDPAGFERTRKYWNGAWKRFVVELTEKERKRRFAEHRSERGFPELSTRAPLASFLALSLDERRRPIPVLHGDTALMLLDLPLDERALDLCLAPFECAFPEGLASDAGMMVACASTAPDAPLRELFAPTRYHGEVVWGWPMVLLEAACLRRLGSWPTAAPFTPEAGKARLRALLERVRALRASLGAWDGAELWSFKLRRGRVEPAPFGQDGRTETESNAVQLWSVAGLGVAGAW